MNQFIWCAETEHGICFGKCHADNGQVAKDLVVFLLTEGGHKTIIRFELLGITTTPFQVKWFKPS